MTVSWRRWLVLGALMSVTLACEAQWLIHAAVSRPAEQFYAGQVVPGTLWTVDLLALLYMVVFLAAALPASWVLERWGLGVGVGAGAVLTIAGSLGKAWLSRSFAAQVVFQTLLAVAQPFLINAATTLARQWFRPQERATAAALASLAQYLGFIAALALTPHLVQGDPGRPLYGSGLDSALAVFAVVSVVAGVLALTLVRRGPLLAPEADARPFGQLLGQLFRDKNFLLTTLLFFVGLGILNAVTSLTDTIAASQGIRDSDGLLGVALIVGGLVGALVLPPWSDAARRRRPFLIGGLALGVPALAALAAVHGSFLLSLAAMGLLGLGLMSAGPIGFQYAAETTAVPEAVSQGVLLWVGQISGILLTALLSALRADDFPWALGFLAVAMLTLAVLTTRLRESIVPTEPASRTNGSTRTASTRPPSGETGGRRPDPDPRSRRGRPSQ